MLQASNECAFIKPKKHYISRLCTVLNRIRVESDLQSLHAAVIINIQVLLETGVCIQWELVWSKKEEKNKPALFEHLMR